MANTKSKKQDNIEEKVEKMNQEPAVDETEENGESKETKEPEPEKKGVLTVVKGLASKAWGGIKKAAPYAGAAVAGAGITIGAIAIALAKGDAADDVPLLESEDLTNVDDFIDGEAEVVDVDES